MALVNPIPPTIPLLNTNWAIAIDGIPIGRIKNLKTPKKEVQTLIFGNAFNSMDTKLPGKASVDQLSFDIIIAENEPIEAFQKLLEVGADGLVLGALIQPSLVLYDSTGLVPVKFIEFGYAFVKSCQLGDLKTKTSEQDILYKSIVLEASDYQEV